MPRRALTLAALVAAALVALVALLLLSGADDGDAVPPLRATPAAVVGPAPVTAGTDSTGAPVSVPRAGRPAVVTFLFANCPTVCPLLGTQVSAALDRLDPAVRERVDVVAVSVDPRGDTPAAVRRFLARHDLTGRMSYIVGTRAELTPLWDAWGILAQPDGDATASVHTARVVLIDREGRQVGSYPGGAPVPPDDLAADITSLASG
jgi:protein SCO1